MATDMFLYWGSGSPPCWKLMLVLAEKKLQYKDKLVSFSKKEHKTDEVLKLNHRGQVPTLRIGDMAINESMAACDYLETVYKNQGTQLLPSDPAALAMVLQRKYEISNIQKKSSEDLIYYFRGTKPEDRNEELVKTRKEACINELKIWDGYLEQLGDGSFIAGKDFSMADVILFPTLAYMVRMGLELSPRFPHLAAYYQMLQERPSVKATWPPHWKEAANPNPILSDV